nr:MAG TPA_asm: protein of unknown function (DUF4373) [Caudoviricetes sp.]
MKYNCIRNSDSPEVMRARMKHGIAAYGIYVALMQLLEEDENHKLSKDYSMIAYEMRVDVSVVQSVVEDFDLFEVEEEYFYSKELSDTIEQARKVSEARARAGRAGGAAKARNFVANAKESSSKCQANARKNVANASESLANAKQMPESKESSPNPSKNIYSVPTEREDNIKLSSPSSARTRKSKPKEFTICHKGRQIFEKYYQELYDSAYYWQPKDAKAMNSILKKISFARSHKTVPLPIDDESLLKALEEFLRRIDKTWIMNNFSVNKIDSQYNEIVSEMKNHKQNVTSNGNKYRKESGVPKYESKAAYESGFGSANR